MKKGFIKLIIILVFVITLVGILTIQYQQYENMKFGEENGCAFSLKLKMEYYDIFFMNRVDNFEQLKSHPDMKSNVEAILAKYNFGFYREIKEGSVYYYVLSKENSKNMGRNELMTINEMGFLEYLFHFKPIILESVMVDLNQTLCYFTTTDKTKIIFYKERKFVCNDSVFSIYVWDAFNKSLEVNGLKVLSRSELFGQLEFPDKQSFQVLKTVVDSLGELRSTLHCSSSIPSSDINSFMDSLDYYLNKIPKPTNLTMDSLYLKTSCLYPVEVN